MKIELHRARFATRVRNLAKTRTFESAAAMRDAYTSAYGHKMAYSTFMNTIYKKGLQDEVARAITRKRPTR